MKKTNKYKITGLIALISMLLISSCSETPNKSEITDDLTPSQQSAPATPQSSPSSMKTEIPDELTPSPQSVPASMNSNQCTALTSDLINGGISLSAGCYHVTSELKLSEGLIQMEPGVNIYFAEDIGFKVSPQGRLKAEGTPDNPVVMTSLDQSKYWRGLNIEGSDSDENSLKHTIIEYGGFEATDCGEPANLSLDRHSSGSPAKLKLDHVQLKNGKGLGFCFGGESIITEFKNSTIVNNQQGAGLADPNNLTMFPTDQNEANSFTIQQANNERIAEVPLSNPLNQLDNYIAIRGGSIALADQNSVEKVAKIDVAYRILDDLSIGVGILEFQAGTVLEFSERVGFEIHDEGRMKIAGTQAEPVYFTTVDKSTPKYWKGLLFDGSNSSDNLIEHLVLEYAGSHDYSNVIASAIGIERSTAGVESRILIRNSTISNSHGHGIYVFNGHVEDCSQLNMYNNAKSNIEASDRAGSVCTS